MPHSCSNIELELSLPHSYSNIELELSVPHSCSNIELELSVPHSCSNIELELSMPQSYSNIVAHYCFSYNQQARSIKKKVYSILYHSCDTDEDSISSSHNYNERLSISYTLEEIQITELG
jgi:hypothetical protein